MWQGDDEDPSTYLSCDGQRRRFDADENKILHKKIELVQYKLLTHG